MSWDSFVWFALTAVLLWAAGAFFAWKERKPLVYACTLTGIALFFAFILGMWISLERPPLRTMGETRLWYSPDFITFLRHHIAHNDNQRVT